MKPKFTPGPWLCCHRPESPTIHYIHSDNGSSCIGPFEIATVFESSGDGIQQRANAHLIAAAPEMYEALDALIDVIAGNQKQSLAAATDHALYALKKARGEL